MEVVRRDARILNLALSALYVEREKIDAEINAIEKQLGRKSSDIHPQGQVSPKRMSTAGRKAISDAMKRRWTAYRADKAKRAAKR